MNDATPCPKCGSMLPADAPQGLCPRCLAALNFATETMPPEGVAMSHEVPLTPEELAPHFPQLEILECLGRGGMGVVYKARQKSLNRLVALKLLAPERAGDAKFALRFAREAQALATLSHPHIVTIHDFGQAGGFYFLLMEFIDGVNLRQAMKAGRFTPDQALAIVPPVCEALQYAHEHGIVHRDIKPENLLLDKTGRVKIADFGIAKIIDLDEAAEAPPDDSRTTMAGTPAYAAPEQQGGQADHRADIYSLGVVLYELLTGELPGKNLAPPSQRVQIDVRLDEVVLRALETQPELRYATAAEFRTRLESFTTVKKPALPPSTNLVAAAFAAVWTLTAFPLVSYAVDGLRVTNTLVIAAVLLVIVAVVLGVLAPAFVMKPQHRRWLRGTSWLAWVLTMPAWGFGIFFLDAFIHQNGPWNPAVSEAFVVPLFWLACLILPAGALVLRSASAEPPRAFTRWGRLVFSGLVILAVALGGMEIDHQRRLASIQAREEPLRGITPPPVVTPQGQFGISWLVFAIQLVLLAAFIAFVVWLVRRALRSKRPGCLILLFLFIGALLMMLGAAVVWYLRAAGPSAQARPVTSQHSLNAVPAEADSFLDWAGREIEKLEIEKAGLRAQLGPKHPLILGIDAQIARLEKKKAEVIAAPAPIDNDGLIRHGGLRQLNDRYEVTLDVKVKGEKTDLLPAATMRGYRIRSKMDGGAAALKTYVPLAMDGEPFAAFWDAGKQELWLASPTVVSRHHLPLDGAADHEMQFVADMTDRFSRSRPAVVAQGMEEWVKTIALLPRSPNVPALDLSKPQPEEKPLRDFLQKPSDSAGSRVTLFVAVRRMHFFDKSIPEPKEKEVVEIAAGGIRGLAFITKNTTTSKKAAEMLPWGETKACLITFRWQTDGKTRWLEVLEMNELAAWVR